MYETILYKALKRYIYVATSMEKPVSKDMNVNCPFTDRWKEISRVKEARFTLLPASVKGLKRLVEGGTCYEKTVSVIGLRHPKSLENVIPPVPLTL
jgi:hypothetical protein